MDPRRSAELARTLAAVACVVALVACASSGAANRPLSPGEAITVAVSNRSGEVVFIGYSFARTPVVHLGRVPRRDEAHFSFAWEPGPLEFAAEMPGGLLTSNRMSPAPGDTLLLEVTSRRLRATKRDGTT